ncbi:MAG: sulfate ABC transporter permease subunit CysT [Sedimentisphaerales bacterium]|nr:sulfate ABC transporter permease subunit CysT [Sedimentisphaerales bacterium]
MKYQFKQYNILPGFGLTLGYTVVYLGLLVLLPLAALTLSALQMTWPEFWSAISSQRAIRSFALTFGTSFIAAVINTIFGLLIAWCLSRMSFPGRKIIDAMIDLPFALPTAISGIALTAVYAPNGILGEPLARLGIKVAYTPIGIIIAMILVGLPFVVRTVQPVLAELERELEEAALGLGASNWQTFSKVIFPLVLPSLLTGFTLAFARNLGEYDSVVFIAGNMPMKTEITSLLIVTHLEQYDYAGATALASAMLIISFVLLLTINLLQTWSGRRLK